MTDPLTRSLYIELNVDGVIEAREVTDDEQSVELMASLGWCRIDQAMTFAQDCAEAGRLLKDGAAELAPRALIPDLPTNGHAIGTTAGGAEVMKLATAEDSPELFAAGKRPSVAIRTRAHAKAEKRGGEAIQSDLWYALMDWLDEHCEELGR
jgi:hypothetical protein